MMQSKTQCAGQCADVQALNFVLIISKPTWNDWWLSTAKIKLTIGMRVEFF